MFLETNSRKIPETDLDFPGLNSGMKSPTRMHLIHPDWDFLKERRPFSIELKK